MRISPEAKPLIMFVGKSDGQSLVLLQALRDALNVDCAWQPDRDVNAIIRAQDNGPALLLWDCLERDPQSIERLLGLIGVEPGQLVPMVLFNVSPEHPIEPIVNRVKCRGVFYQQDDFDLFVRGLRAILDGELWLPRKILSECIDMSCNSRDTDLSEHQPLSRREKEILLRVCGGLGNKQIAEELNISQHTVKTHLYKIYHKIEVPNRLQAMLWAATYLNPPA